MKDRIGRPQLTEDDCNFDRVPGRELVACLLWEYLLESQTAQELAQDWCAWVGHAARGENDNQAELFARTKTLTFKLNHKLNMPEFLIRAVGPAWGFGRLTNVPWQELHPKTKQWLVEPCERVNEPVFIGREMHAAQLADDAKKRLNEEFDKIRDGDTLSMPPARAPLRFFTVGPGWESLCVVVDWGRYDNAAIRKAFHRLGDDIIKTRPKGVKPQARTGSGLQRATELRGMLNELGLARLFGHYGSAVTLRTQNPRAYARIAKTLSDKGITAVQKKLDGATRRFLDRFHEILPFEGGSPLCVRSGRIAK